MEVRCKHCNHLWDYKGSSLYFATCPACHYKVKLNPETRPGKFSDEEMKNLTYKDIAPGLGEFGFGPKYNERPVPRDKIDICKEWIQKYIIPQDKINRKYGSYALKHVVEGWNEYREFDDYYIPNGAFIAAAVELGYRFQINGPNAQFNMDFSNIEADPIRSGLNQVNNLPALAAKDGRSKLSAECRGCKLVLPREELLPVKLERFSSRTTYLCFGCIKNMVEEGIDSQAKLSEWLFGFVTGSYDRAKPKRSAFTKWLMKQKSREDAIGDLARDALEDAEWPSSDNDLEIFKEHLESSGACDAAIDALESAWSEFESEGKNVKRA